MSLIKSAKRKFGTVPEDHRIKAVSILKDADGNPVKEWEKTERSSNDPPAFPPVPAGHLIKKTATLLDSQGQVRQQWVSSSPEEKARWDIFWEACRAATKEYAGLIDPAPPPAHTEDDILTMYPLGDPHVGMLAWAPESGEDFDLKIASRDLRHVVRLLAAGAPDSSRAIIANVGDFFHAQSDDQLTPHGKNKLDVDSRQGKILRVGLALFRDLVDMLLRKHSKVDVINVPGNHDPQVSRMLALLLQVCYEKEPRVNVVENLNPFMFLRHGKNLFGFTHGDEVKPEMLSALMAHDRPKDWGETEYRYWITGHIHHIMRKEYAGCIVESFRTLAAKDAWHNGKGYRAGRSLSAITYHKEWGEISRNTVDLAYARSLQAAQ